MTVDFTAIFAPDIHTSTGAFPLALSFAEAAGLSAEVQKALQSAEEITGYRTTVPKWSTVEYAKPYWDRTERGDICPVFAAYVSCALFGEDHCRAFMEACDVWPEHAGPAAAAARELSTRVGDVFDAVRQYQHHYAAGEFEKAHFTSAYSDGLSSDLFQAVVIRLFSQKIIKVFHSKGIKNISVVKSMINLGVACDGKYVWFLYCAMGVYDEYNTNKEYILPCSMGVRRAADLKDWENFNTLRWLKFPDQIINGDIDILSTENVYVIKDVLYWMYGYIVSDKTKTFWERKGIINIQEAKRVMKYVDPIFGEMDRHEQMNSTIFIPYAFSTVQSKVESSGRVFYDDDKPCKKNQSFSQVIAAIEKINPADAVAKEAYNNDSHPMLIEIAEELVDRPELPRGILDGLIEALRAANSPKQPSPFVLLLATAKEESVKKIEVPKEVLADLPPLTLKEGGRALTQEELSALVALAIHHEKASDPLPEVKAILKLLAKDDAAVFGNAILHRWARFAPELSGLLVFPFHACTPEPLPNLGRIFNMRKWHNRESVSGLMKVLAKLNSLDALKWLMFGRERVKYKPQKQTATSAIKRICEKLGLSEEQAAEYAMPDFGFSEEGTQILDYGARHFTLKLAPDLSLQILDDKGKVKKSLPTAAKDDNPESVKEAKATLKDLRPALKTAGGQLIHMLDRAVATSRAWPGKAFQRVFTQHPIARWPAAHLVWQAPDGTLFRPETDGALLGVDGDPIDLDPAEASFIRLPHPLDLSAAEREAWAAHSADFELAPPVRQLDRAVMPGAWDGPAILSQVTSLDTCTGVTMNYLSLAGKLLDCGWKRDVIDAGGVIGFTAEAPGILVSLPFTEGYGQVGGYVENPEPVTLGPITILQMDTTGDEAALRARVRDLSEIWLSVHNAVSSQG